MDLISKEAFFHLFRYISLGLASLAIFYPGSIFFLNSIRALRKKQLHLDLPISLALAFAFAYSAVHTIVGQGQVYFDSLVAIIFLLLTGRFLQKKPWIAANELTSVKRPKTIASSEKLRKKKLARFRQKQIRSGDTLKMLPGDILPVAATMNDTHGEISLEFMTGEQDWKQVEAGDALPSGSLIGSKPLLVTCTEDFENSYLYSIRRSVDDLFAQKGSYLTLSDKMSKFLVLFILTVAASLFISLAGHNFDEAISRTMATLLIACPCAFGLGAPLIISRAFHLGIKNKLIFKGQRALENLYKIQKVYFDKTGTLTKASTKLKNTFFDEKVMEFEEFTKMMLNLDRYSQHHVPEALGKWALENNSKKSEIILEDFQEIQSQGISFKYRSFQVKIGRAKFCGIVDSSATVVVSVNGNHLASFGLEEELQEGSSELMNFFQAQNIDAAIISGDRGSNVTDIGRALRIDDAHGQLTTEDKLAKIQDENKLAAMVGNGINDSLALAKAPISIAVKGSSLLAQESADIALRTDDLGAIQKAINISSKCRRTLIRGFAFAFSFNLLGITLGALGYLTPVLAAILMPISSLTIVFDFYKLGGLVWKYYMF